MARQHDIDASFYSVADRFVDNCLRQQGSLFSPGRSIWTADHAAELYSRVVENPDFGKADFAPKLRGQLAGAPDEVVLFAAELLYVLLLTQDQGMQSKLEVLEPVLQAGSAPIVIPADLLAALSHGIASYGAALAFRYWQYVLLLEFLRAWTKLGADERTQLLADADRFQAFMRQLPDKGASSQIEALLYLVFPDVFEPVVSVPIQDRIIKAFPQFSGDDSLPRYKRLALIRTALSPEYGDDLSLYQPDIKRLWSDEKVKPLSQPVHLVVKWSVQYGVQTVDDHRAVEERSGAVWWGLIGSAEKPKLAAKWLEAIRQQLKTGEPTHIFISGPSCWRTTLLDIATNRDEVETDLIPSYYPSELEHNLWVKIRDFEPIDRAWLTEHLELVSAAGKPLSAGALSNQTNPLIVHVTETARSRAPRVWWVCQGTTYAAAREQEVMWAPKRAKDGHERPYWRALTEAHVGDIVLHYANNNVRATSVIAKESIDAPAPGPSPDGWEGQDGWLVRTTYHELQPPLSLDKIPIEWRTAEGGPFTKQGAVQQGYFYPLSPSFTKRLAERFPQLGLGDRKVKSPTPPTAYVEPPFEAIVESIRSAGLRLDEQTIRRYHISLKTRGFVVLSGLSGSGKTWLAQLYAKAVRAEALLVSVAPNWTTNEDLLGYYDPLAREYRHTSFSRFLEEAAAAWTAAQQAGISAQPFHLILDEMNLARVEYYFAKFLSAMEIRARDKAARLELDAETETSLTPNLYFVGTVNVDETTHGFADKIYDRAQLIEVPIPQDGIEAHLALQPYRADLVKVWIAMRPVAPFAYRVLDEIHTYVVEAATLGVTADMALDEQLLQKVLPKVKGTEKGIGDALRSFLELGNGRWPLSQAKAVEMLAVFDAHGFTSYF